MHKDLFEKYGAVLAGSDRAEALYHLGESARRSGELDAAIAPLKEAADLDPSNPRPFRSLAKIYDEKGEFAAVDRGASPAPAARHRAGALRAAPRDRRRHVHEAERPHRRVEGLHAGPRGAAGRSPSAHEADAALLGGEGLGEARRRRPPPRRLRRGREAAREVHAHGGDHRRRSTSARSTRRSASTPRSSSSTRRTRRRSTRPSSSIASKGAHHDVERLLKLQIEQAKATSDRDKLVRVLDQLGELYQKHLNEPELAIDAYEAAQAFDPEDRARAEKLAELYALDPKQYLDKAVKSQTQILRRNPYRVESYKLLRKLFTDAKKADPAWCLCQALSRAAPRRAGRGALLQEAPLRERGAGAGRARRGRVDTRSCTGTSIRWSRASSR